MLKATVITKSMMNSACIFHYQIETIWEHSTAVKRQSQKQKESIPIKKLMDAGNVQKIVIKAESTIQNLN